MRTVSFTCMIQREKKMKKFYKYICYQQYSSEKETHWGSNVTEAFGKTLRKKKKRCNHKYFLNN